MPKENTHVLFADKVAFSLEEGAMSRAVRAQDATYHLGAIAPDVFFYAGEKRLEDISSRLHGKENTPTNDVILELLDEVRDQPYGLRDLVFSLGYLTHCALDMTLHPVIYALAGDYYDPDPQRRREAVYLHRHLETCLDLHLGNRARIQALIPVSTASGLAFGRLIARRYGIPPEAFPRALRRQLRFNRLFSSRAAFLLLSTLDRCGVLDAREELALFYGNVTRDKATLPESITYHDPAIGQEVHTSLERLMQTARDLATDMLQAAWGYVYDGTTRHELLAIIPGASLDTGRVALSANDCP